MEPKKIKKLIINQEVISNLNEGAMSRIKGGGTIGCGPGSANLCTITVCTELKNTIPMCPIESYTCHTYTCDTIILDSDCYSQDYEICRFSDYYPCN